MTKNDEYLISSNENNPITIIERDVVVTRIYEIGEEIEEYILKMNGYSKDSKVSIHK
ncbi:hypothetical protein KPL39_12320 [Clostridium gasigenes]|uniref:hypothetical protein n=1 Tax=Clostridium gasigenes TaxID=94869 RepID=UPI001C0C22B5|nr:hypothetical protein [Clostridium gasigenes]MBU3137050.1 hypothetical protein [Clostridium gasigenes]